MGSGIVSDPATRQQIEIDVAVVEAGAGDRKPTVAMLGEAKWGTVMGSGHLAKLRRAREVLAGRGMDVAHCVLACFSGAGFSDALRAEVSQGKEPVLLLGLDELYGRVPPAPFFG
ncbi:hypothetical protein ABT224_01610 [Streptomyces sp. NPDC001584]|uniref:hypothetical protein n=1 Tax=Streptomyces sp. NPDC001584 TaxID=3154521 RepID=UPI003327530F